MPREPVSPTVPAHTMPQETMPPAHRPAARPALSDHAPARHQPERRAGAGSTFGGFTVRVEALDQMADEAALLAAAHWREVEAALHGQEEYSLDYSRYAALERLNMLMVLAVRDAAGRLAGYAAFTLAPCPHLAGDVVAALDGLYLVPAARRGLVALSLLRHAETALAGRGATLVQYSSPASRPCDALYRRLGAVRTETIWHRRLSAREQPPVTDKGETQWP